MAGYTLVTNAVDLGPAGDAIAASDGPVGFDTETTGLDHARHQVRLLQLATNRGTFLIDVFAVGPAALRPVFEALAAVGVVGHNLGFDLPFLMRLGFVPGRVVDTMLASQVLHAGDVAIKHGLRDVAARHLGLTLDKELQQADWAGTLTPDMLQYAALDAEVPLRVWAELAAELESAKLTAVAEIEFAALPCVAWAATRGVGLDRPAWQALAADADRERARLRESLDTTAPDGTTLFGARNWDSPDDVKAALAAVGVVLEATDDDALAAVAHPLAGLVRDYRSAARLALSYDADCGLHEWAHWPFAPWATPPAGFQFPRALVEWLLKPPRGWFFGHTCGRCGLRVPLLPNDSNDPATPPIMVFPSCPACGGRTSSAAGGWREPPRCD